MSERKSYKSLIIWFWVLFIGSIMSVILLFFLIDKGAFGDLPDFSELENPKSNLATEVYTADQKLLGKYFRENRSNAEYKELSPYLIHALTATEDERFRSHSGIDAKGLARAIAFLGTRGGASTITQQLAKMLFHDREKNMVKRMVQKLKEWIIAVRLERQYTKDEILTMYLNKFDFINNAVGIKSASSVYFNTTPTELKLEEAALLIGMAKNPALFNPVRRPDTTLHRRNVVLYQMLRNKYITQEEFDSVSQLEIELDYTKVDHRVGMAPYFREKLRSELKRIFAEKNAGTDDYLLKKPDGKPYNIYKDGLKIYTTIDSRMQQYAEKAVAKHLGEELQKELDKDLKRKKNAPFDWRMTSQEIEKILTLSMKRSERYRLLKKAGVEMDSIKKIFKTPVEMKIFSWGKELDTILSPWDSIRYYKGFLQAGMMAMDPHTGFIKAWVGGVDFKHFSYDHVKQGRRQVGSTFKPFVYALAIEEIGFSPCLEVPNVKTCFDLPDGKTWCPKNSDGEYGGMVSLKYGMANSMNTITAWVMKQLNPAAIVQFVKKMGVESPLDPVPALCLGVADLSVYELVGANATFANKGIWTKPIFITRIEDKDGAVIKDFKPETRVIMSEESAYVMLDLMKGVIDGVYNRHTGKKMGTGVRIRFNSRDYGGIKYPMAGKTGTTQNNSDGWFIGLSKDLVAGVWVGAEDRGVRFSRTYYGQGANMSLPIYGYFMNDVYKDKKLNISKEDFEKPENPIKIELDCGKYYQTQNSTIFETYDEDFDH